MSTVRHRVDRLDRKLVTLLVQRQGLMEAAAQIKQDREDVVDQARIEAIIAKVRAEAGRKGLSVAIAEPVWRVLIDRCIAHEFKTFDRLREDGTKKPEGVQHDDGSSPPQVE